MRQRLSASGRDRPIVCPLRLSTIASGVTRSVAMTNSCLYHHSCVTLQPLCKDVECDPAFRANQQANINLRYCSSSVSYITFN